MFFTEDTITEFTLVRPDRRVTIKVEDVTDLWRVLDSQCPGARIPVWIHDKIFGTMFVNKWIYQPHKPFPNYSIARFFDPDEEIQGRWNGYKCECVPMKEGVKSQLPRLEYKRAYVED